MNALGCWCSFARLLAAACVASCRCFPWYPAVHTMSFCDWQYWICVHDWRVRKRTKCMFNKKIIHAQNMRLRSPTLRSKVDPLFDPPSWINFRFSILCVSFYRNIVIRFALYVFSTYTQILNHWGQCAAWGHWNAHNKEHTRMHSQHTQVFYVIRIGPTKVVG